jgi:diaminohydroxyphosphoribosylaminopyrimidine deaminase/5-amino-6-(5-phosphoribosylamino)uracil reductase
MQDPNPQVAGKGLAALEQAGIRVASGCQGAQAEALNPGFIKRMRTGRPYVRCKLAMSLDGRTAMANGESRWITGPAARTDVHRLRARSDAIVTGLGTVVADDPSLNVRLEAGQLWGVGDQDAVPLPLRVVLDPRLEMPPDAGMTRLPGNTLAVCSEPQAERRELLEQAGVEVVELPGEGSRISLNALLDHLGQRQINEVLIEAGPTLAGAAVGEGLVDELVIYAAPHLMGDGARGLLHLPGLARMEDRIGLEIRDLRMVGRDIRLTLKPEVEISVRHRAKKSERSL